MSNSDKILIDKSHSVTHSSPLEFMTMGLKGRLQKFRFYKPI